MADAPQNTLRQTGGFSERFRIEDAEFVAVIAPWTSLPFVSATLGAGYEQRTAQAHRAGDRDHRFHNTSEFYNTSEPSHTSS